MAAEAQGPFRCRRCGMVTTGNMDFCESCGQPLNIECPGCGRIWRHYFEYEYCRDCGTKVADGRPAGERAESMAQDSAPRRRGDF